MALGIVVGPKRTGYRGDQDLFARELAPFRNQAIQAAMVGVNQTVAAAGADLIVAAAAEARRVTSTQLAELVKLLERGVADSDRQRLHERIGRQAIDSTVRSYIGTAKRTRNQSGYRAGGSEKWRRYSGGRLLAALKSDAMFTATADRLEWINVDHLNRAAAQWARLNFGAGARGKGSLALRPVTFGGVVLASLGLDEPARPGFAIPQGYFVGEGGEPVAPNSARTGVAFYPAGTGPFRGKTMRSGTSGEKRSPIPMVKRKPTRGIRGRNFLDIGAQRIAREIGPGYEQLFRELFNRGEATIRPRSWNIYVPSRARSFYRG